LAIRLVMVEAEQAGEVEALGRAVERVILALRGDGGEGLGGERFAITGLGRAAIADGEAAEVRALGDGGAAVVPPMAEAPLAGDLVRIAVEAEAGLAGEAEARTARPRRSVRGGRGEPAERTARRRAGSARSQEGGFACEEPGCGKSFPTAQGLRTHRGRAHRDPDSRTAERARRAAAGGAQRCDQPGCGRSFLNAQGLGRHRFSAHGIAGQSSGARHRRKLAEAAAAEQGRDAQAVAASARATEAGAGARARATAGPRKRPRTRIYDGVPGSLARHGTVLSSPPLDSRSVDGR
jgi:hypothetical protein